MGVVGQVVEADKKVVERVTVLHPSIQGLYYQQKGSGLTMSWLAKAKIFTKKWSV